MTNDNALRLDFEAVTDKATVINLTNHIYFNLNGNSTSTLGASYSFELTPDCRVEATLQRKTANQITGPASATLVGVNLNYSLPDF